MVLFLVICSAEIPILAQNITQECGIDPKESAKHFPKRGYSPYEIGYFQQDHYGGIRTFILLTRRMPSPSVIAWALKKPTVLRKEKL
jgi:hypothetical protein